MHPANVHPLPAPRRKGRALDAANRVLNYAILAAAAAFLVFLVASAARAEGADPLSPYADRLAAATVVTPEGETFIDRSQFTGPEWEEIAAAAALSDGLGTELIGGTVADPKDWPASPWVSNCSSTLIGPRVLDTAAHCVGNGGTKRWTTGGVSYSARCTHHPRYRGNSTADWALCVADKVITGVPYENVPKDEAEVGCAAGVKFTLTGYGCQRWGGGIDGKFRFGEAAATSCPRGTNYDVVTRGTTALCSGDSGGGGYTSSGAGRLAALVNSRSNTTTTSYMPSRGTAAFRDWAMGWAAANGVKICGLHGDAEGCRDSAPPPAPLPPLPERCRPMLEKVTACLFGEPVRHAVTEPDACRQAVLVVGECELDAEKSE